MAFEVTMPQMGADMAEGTLVRWFKQVGEHVNRGEILAEIETDKANVELEAYESGTVLKHVVPEGEVVPVGEIIALLGEASEQVADVERQPAVKAPPPPRAESPTPAPVGETAVASEAAPPQPTLAAAEVAPLLPAEVAAEAPPSQPAVLADAEVAPSQPTAVAAEAPPPQPAEAAPAGTAGAGRVRISPVAKRIANQAGVDITALTGSGPDGRILRRDVEAAVAAPKPAVAEATAKPPQTALAEPPRQADRGARPEVAPGATGPGLSKIRQAIARRMTLSKQTQPHYYLTLDIDMTAAMKFREQLNSSASKVQRVSVNDLVVKACAIALERHPKFNAAFAESGLVMHERINIDIGVALDEGLIAPAILDCGLKSLGHIATESKDLIERAKTGRLRADEYSEGTFTITNLGAYGVEMLIGIINPPQAAILGVGSVMDQAVVRDGQVVAAKVMKVALSADHRVSDGAEGARFIKEIQGLLENPVSLAL